MIRKNNDIYKTLLENSIKMEKLITTSLHGSVWQLGLVFDPKNQQYISDLISPYKENRRKLTKLHLKTDFSYWIPHADYYFVPLTLYQENIVDRVSFSKSSPYSIKYLNLDEPDNAKVILLEKLAKKAKLGIPTGTPPLIIYKKLEEAKSTPLRKKLEKIILREVNVKESNLKLEKLNEAKYAFVTNFNSASKRLVASWYANELSKTTRLPQGISIFFSNEIYKRSDAKIYRLIEKATQSNAYIGNYFFPETFDLPKNHVILKNEDRNS